MIFSLDTPYWVGFLIAATAPVLLYLQFRFRGQPTRLNYLQSAAPHDAPAWILVPGASDVHERLGDYLKKSYEEAHTGTKYLLPLLFFEAIWVFGWYWTLVGLAIFLRQGEPLWQAVPFTVPFSTLPAAAFLGAACAVGGQLTWRVVRGDLQSRAFVHLGGRLATATVLAWVIAEFAQGGTDSVRAGVFTAFLGGLFGRDVWVWLERTAVERFGTKDQATKGLSLRLLQGLERDDEIRLWEEGITDVQHMATESLPSLLVHSPYPVERLIDWKDQAFLVVYVRQDVEAWRDAGCRGAMDVLGMAPPYLRDNYCGIVKAFAARLGWPLPVLERLINTIYSDPRVHQLWNYLLQAYPARPAAPVSGTDDNWTMCGDEGSETPSPPAPAAPDRAVPPLAQGQPPPEEQPRESPTDPPAP